MSLYIDESEIAELRAEVRYQQRQHQAFLAAPDCRDPDHPGCPACMDDDAAENHSHGSQA